METQIKTVGVIGLGVMGFDIAFLYAMKGFRTLAYDAAKAAMDSLPDRREQTIDRLQKRNRISGGEIDNLRTLLVPADGVAALAQANLVTEAVSEKTQVKLAVYKVSPRRRLRRPADDQHIVGHPRDSIARWDRQPREFFPDALFQSRALHADGRSRQR